MPSPEVINMISIKGISKSYGATDLFCDVNLEINEGARIGLLGPNGCGKSTLLKIIYGVEDPERGRVIKRSGINVGYLPQDFSKHKDQKVADLFHMFGAEDNNLRERLGEFEHRIALPEVINSESYADILDEYMALVARAEQLDNPAFENRRKRIFEGLGLSQVNQDRSVDSLSSGEKSRVWLGKLLLEDPDVYLFDEPTNHLDLAALEWLESFIRTERHAFVLVSHDRFLLDRSIKSVFAYDAQNQTFRLYKGGYSAYLEIQEREREKYRQQYERQQEELKALEAAVKQSVHTMRFGSNRGRRDNDKLGFNYKAQRGVRASARKIRQAKQQLEVLEEEKIAPPVNQWRINPAFIKEYDAGDSVLSIRSLTKRFANKSVLEGISAELRRKDKIALMGPNGAGKTTLLKIIAGPDQADQGEVNLGQGIKPGYMSQEHEDLDFNRTVLEEYRQGLVGLEEDLRRDLWIYGLFGSEDVGKKVGNLSSGQRARLIIAKMVAQGVNFLLLDEPTNHLDVDSQEQLQQSIHAFQGPVLFVSHDRWFIDKIANGIWLLKDGGLKKQMGNYSENHRWIDKQFGQLQGLR